MKYLIILCLLVSGCSFTNFVDAKGRDCKRNEILFSRWETCETKQEPLATTRHQIELDAQVENK